MSIAAVENVDAEAPLNDHRRLGRELDLFDSDPLIGAGLPYWLPDGATVRHTLEEYIRGLEVEAGYQHVYSPVLGKRELYEISGHWSHYSDDMFPPMDLGNGEQMLLRPSLCPHHAVMFRSRSHSYRELPLRMAEIGGMYRAELSGALGGLTRVRAITLNDAHVFCTLEQVASEARKALDLIGRAYQAMGISAAYYRLSLPGPGGKYIDKPDMWARATEMLREVLEDAGIEYVAAEGEAAFYGPKIDIQIADPAGRESTLSTVQIDFHQPEQFGLEYVGPDGAKHRPVMVHRAIVGSLERVVAHLIEQHGGAFPAWLAPRAGGGAAGLGRRAGRGGRAARALLGGRPAGRGRGPERGDPGRADPGGAPGAVPGGDRLPRGRRGLGLAARAGRPAGRGARGGGVRGGGAGAGRGSGGRVVGLIMVRLGARLPITFYKVNILSATR